MVPRQIMILWSKATSESFDLTAAKSYKLMQLLMDFGPELYPKYQTVYKKKDAKPFEWSYDHFSNRLGENVSREGQTIFTELGYSISFFSSLNNKDSAGIGLFIGNRNPRFSNTFGCDFPLSYNISNEKEYNRIVPFFRKCIEVFEPYWGCVANSINAKRFDKYMKDGLPTAIHWLNYFGNDIIQRVHEDYIVKAPIYEVENIGDGYILRLDNAPLNEEIPESIAIQTKANEYFRFSNVM